MYVKFVQQTKGKNDFNYRKKEIKSIKPHFFLINNILSGELDEF